MCKTWSAAQYTAVQASFLSREGSRFVIGVLGVLQALAGLISIVIWSIMYVNNNGVSGRIDQGTGIWSGAVAFAAGVFGILVIITAIKPRIRMTMMYVHFALTMCTIGICIQQVIGSHEVWKVCRSTEPEPYCLEHPDQASLALVCLVMSAIIEACVIPEFIVCLIINCGAKRACSAEITEGKDNDMHIAP